MRSGSFCAKPTKQAPMAAQSSAVLCSITVKVARGRMVAFMDPSSWAPGVPLRATLILISQARPVARTGLEVEVRFLLARRVGIALGSFVDLVAEDAPLHGVLDPGHQRFEYGSVGEEHQAEGDGG